MSNADVKQRNKNVASCLLLPLTAPTLPVQMLEDHTKRLPAGGVHSYRLDVPRHTDGWRAGTTHPAAVTSCLSVGGGGCNRGEWRQ